MSEVIKAKSLEEYNKEFHIEIPNIEISIVNIKESIVVIDHDGGKHTIPASVRVVVNGQEKELFEGDNITANRAFTLAYKHNHG